MKAPITPDPRPARECDSGVGAESLWSFKFGKLNMSVKLGSQELLITNLTLVFELGLSIISSRFL